MGFGVVRAVGGRFEAAGYGAIRTEAGTPLSERLEDIYCDMERLLEAYVPEAVAVEELFFNTNHKTAISVAHGRGVMLLACRKRGVPVYEYTPLQVKQAVAGYGRAEKKQIMDMVKRLLSLDETPKPDDAADALAIALCHGRAATSLLYGLREKKRCFTI